ncbi:3D domain-containing protein [Pseudoneobacillus sp. C159]
MLKKKLTSLLAVAVLSGTVSANVQAASVTAPTESALLEQTETNGKPIDVINKGEVLATTPRHMIKEGDTLWIIAKKYKVSVEQIMKWNNLSTDLIHPGVELFVQNQAVLSQKEESIAASISENSKSDAESNPPPKEESSSSILGVEEKSTKDNSDAQAAENNSPNKETQDNKEIESKTKNDKSDLSNKKKKSKVITVKATAYTAYCKGCSGITKTGINLKKNPKKKVIAVDPKVIPLGTKVHVEGFGTAVAADIGSAIKGKRIDVFIPNKKRAIKFGVKNLKVTIID